MRRLRRARTPDVAEDDGRDSLLARLPKRSRGIEIGVWKGDFSARILRSVAPTELHLVDPWKYEPSDRYSDAWYGGTSMDQAAMDAIFEQVQKRFAKERRRGVVRIHRMPAVEAAAGFAASSLDWAYIDGNHLFEFVSADLDAYWPKVRSGGLLTGDDYVEGQWWGGGVKRAVDAFIARHDIVDASFLGTQFVIPKP